MMGSEVSRNQSHPEWQVISQHLQAARKMGSAGKYFHSGVRGYAEFMHDLLQPAKDVEKEEQQRMAGEAQELKQAPAPQAPAFEPVGRYRKVGDFRNYR